MPRIEGASRGLDSTTLRVAGLQAGAIELSPMDRRRRRVTTTRWQKGMVCCTPMGRFKSNEEVFQAVRDLIVRLDLHGHREAATELGTGFGCLNGLTDGWALFLESLEKVLAAEARPFDSDEKRMVDALRAAARAAVYQR